LEKMKVFEKAANFVRENYDKLVELYDGKFIAVLEDKVVAEDKEIEKLLEKLRKKGINPTETFIEYITRRRTAIII